MMHFRRLRYFWKGAERHWRVYWAWGVGGVAGFSLMQWLSQLFLKTLKLMPYVNDVSFFWAVLGSAYGLFYLFTYTRYLFIRLHKEKIRVKFIAALAYLSQMLLMVSFLLFNYLIILFYLGSLHA